MSDRRRSLFVLLIVVALIGGVDLRRRVEEDGPRPGPPGRVAARLQGRADGAAADDRRRRDAARDRPDAAARQRVRRLRGRGPAVRRGPDRGQRAGRQRRRRGSRTRSARPPSCSSTTGKRTSSTRTARPTRTRTRTSARRSTASTRRSRRRRSARTSASVRARTRWRPTHPAVSRRPPRTRASTSSTRQSRKPLADGQTFDSREAALDALQENERANAEVIEVPAGVLVLREQRAEPDDPKPDRWWVVQDRPGLSGTDIKSPEQSFDQTVGNQPIVNFNFTDQGRDAFQAITRRVAERGVDNAFGQDPAADLAALRDRARRRARLGAADQLAREPGRHRRLERRPDLRQLHDPVRAGPGEDPQDRRAAAGAQRGLALAGLGLAR